MHCLEVRGGIFSCHRSTVSHVQNIKNTRERILDINGFCEVNFTCSFYFDNLINEMKLKIVEQGDLIPAQDHLVRLG